MLRQLYPFAFIINILIFMIDISLTFRIIMGVVNILFIICFFHKSRKSEIIYIKWLTCFFCFCLFSCLWTINLKSSLWVTCLQQLPIYLFCVSMFLFVRNWNDLFICFRTYYYASILLLIYVILNVDIFALEGSRLESRGDDQLWNANFIGLYLSVGVYAGYFSTFKNVKIVFFRVLLYLTVSLGMVAIIFLSGSRASLISLITPMLVKIFLSNKNILKTTILISSIGIITYILVMSVPILYSNIGVRIEEMFNILMGDGSGDDSRLVLILSGLLWFKENPILGIGINNFRHISWERLPYSTDFYAHNNYVELLVDIGIIGFIIYCITYIFMVSKIRILDKNKKAWFLSFLIMVMLSDMFHVSYYEMVIQILICTLYLVIKVEKLNNKIYEKD